MDSQVLFAIFFYSSLPYFIKVAPCPINVSVSFLISDTLSRYFFGIIVAHIMLPMPAV